MTQIENRNRQDMAEIQEYRRNHTKSTPVICRHFGCGKKLSLSEQLCGNECTQHIGKKKETVLVNDCKK